MTRCVILFFIVFIFKTEYAQDTLILKRGDTVRCNITKEVGDRIYFDFHKDRRKYNTYLNSDDIQTIKRIKDLRASRYIQDTLSLGFGTGLNYGGIGINLHYFPVRNLGVFAGGGFVFVGLSYNAGLKYRMVNKNRLFNPNFELMYGYQSVVWIRSNSGLNKIFYGFTLGAGLDTNVGKKRKGYWTINLYYPLGLSRVTDYMNDLENKGVEFNSKLYPITLSVGYNLILNKY